MYLLSVIIPPTPVFTIPQPALLEEPPIPIGLRAEFESQQLQQQQQQQQQQHHHHQQPPAQQNASISLVLPTSKTSSKSDATDSKSTALSLSSADDASATLSQQEELSVKGSWTRSDRSIDQRVLAI